MNKKILVIAASLLLVAMCVTPVFAKTRTEVWLEGAGGFDFSTARKVEQPHGKISHFWHVSTSSTFTLMESDKETIIDTFVSSDFGSVKITDSTTFGFVDGVLKVKIDSHWVNEAGDGGFEGIFQWTAIDGKHEMRCVYQGSGIYRGQTLKVSGTFNLAAGQMELDGILIS